MTRPRLFTTRFRIFKRRLRNWWAEISTKPVTRREYRSIGVFALLFTLLMATIVFVVEQRWQMAAMTAAFSVPASLIGGVLCVASDRLPKRAKRQKAFKKLNRKLLAWNVVAGVSMYLALSYAIPSRSTLFIVLITLAVVDYIARRAFRRLRGES